MCIYDEKDVRNLAGAIVIQAAKDYEDSLRNGNNERIKECERFFRSKWYRELTNVDGEYLIERLREKAKEPLDETNEIRVGAD